MHGGLVAVRRRMKKAGSLPPFSLFHRWQSTQVLVYRGAVHKSLATILHAVDFARPEPVIQRCLTQAGVSAGILDG